MLFYCPNFEFLFKQNLFYEEFTACPQPDVAS